MKICSGSKDSWITFNRVTHNPLFRNSSWHLYKSNAWRISSNLCSFFVQPSAIFLVKKRLTFFYSMYYNKKSGHPTPFCIPLVSLSELHSYTIWVYEILHYLSSSTLQFTHTSILLLPFFGVNTSCIYSLSFLPFYFFAPP